MHQFEQYSRLWKKLLYNFAVWAVICWIGLTAQHLEMKGSSILTLLHLKIWNPAVHIYETLSDTFYSIQFHLKTQNDLIAENQRLQKLVRRYQHIEFLYAELLHEVQGFKSFQENSRVYPFSFIIARVILFTPGYISQHELTLGRGKQDGVTMYAPVVDGHGLAGYINAVNAHTSQLRLISHPMFAIGVIIGKEKVRGVLEGTGKFQNLIIRYVPLGAPLEQGSIVYTSGLEGILPPHIPVGTITSSMRSDEGDLVWNMKPYARLASLDWVKILIREPKK